MAARRTFFDDITWMEIAEEIGTENKKLGMYLGIDSTTIGIMEKESHNSVVYETVAILNKWLKKKKPSPDVLIDTDKCLKELCKAFSDMQRNDMVAFVNGKYETFVREQKEINGQQEVDDQCGMSSGKDAATVPMDEVGDGMQNLNIDACMASGFSRHESPQDNTKDGIVQQPDITKYNKRVSSGGAPGRKSSGN